MVLSSWSKQTANNFFVFYAIYLSFLWMTLNYGGTGLDRYTGGGLRWFLITVPLLAYIALNLMLFMLNPKFRADPILFFLLLYLIGVAFSSIINSDLKHFSEVARWVLPIMFIVHFRVSIPLKVINGLFLLAILILVVKYDPAINRYGYLPGQTIANLHQGMWWRISIWTYMTPPYSAAFSILVFFANYFLNNGRSRYIFYFLALYFLVLSGSRTSYFIFIYCGCLIYFLNSFRFELRFFFRIIPVFAVLIIASLQMFADLLLLITIDNEVVNSALFRNDGSEGDTSNLSSRLNIMFEHWRYIQSDDFNYGVGVGSLIYDSLEWTSNGGRLGGTTDSFVSHLVARDGLSLLFLILSFRYFFIDAMKTKNKLAYVMLVILLIYTIGYGAWLNLTSPVFILYMGLLYHQPLSVSRRKNTR